MSFKPSLPQLSQYPLPFPVLLKLEWSCQYSLPGVLPGPLTLPFVPALLEMFFLVHSGITFTLFMATENERAIPSLWSASVLTMHPSPMQSEIFIFKHLLSHSRQRRLQTRAVLGPMLKELSWSLLCDLIHSFAAQPTVAPFLPVPYPSWY